jgi:hypothetical protein
MQFDFLQRTLTVGRDVHPTGQFRLNLLRTQRRLDPGGHASPRLPGTHDDDPMQRVDLE